MKKKASSQSAHDVSHRRIPGPVALGRAMMLAGVILAGVTAACSKTSDEPATEQPAPNSPPAADEEQAVEYVLLDTSKGDILLELDREKAPLTVKSFLQYVDDGYYAGTIFHRVIPGFMVQGGGFTPQMQPKPTSGNVRNESANGLRNDRGTLAMARTPDPHSASSQFFINVVNNDGLNRERAGDGWGYAVFGKVIAGMDAVDLIVAVPTTTVGQHDDVPTEPVLIESAERLSKAEADAKKVDLGK